MTADKSAARDGMDYRCTPLHEPQQSSDTKSAAAWHPGDRPVKLDECSGDDQCRASRHVHGCYTPHRADQCDAPNEYGHLPADGPVKPLDLDAVLAECSPLAEVFGDKTAFGRLYLAAKDAAAALAAETARADQAEQRIADALASFKETMPPFNMELRPDGSEDPVASAYVDGYGVAYQPVHEILSATPTTEQ